MPKPPAFRESGNSAYYMPKQDLVNLPPIDTFRTTEGYVATKFHEYAHSTGHKARLNRPGIMAVAAFGGEDYSFEELVAELTSAYLCANSGIDNTLENSTAYIQNWLQVLRNDKTMLLKASGKATAAVEYIFGKRLETGATPAA
jgi:antirestriction protein ArdC